MDGDNLGKLRIIPDRSLYLEWFMTQMNFAVGWDCELSACW